MVTWRSHLKIYYSSEGAGEETTNGVSAKSSGIIIPSWHPHHEQIWLLQAAKSQHMCHGLKVANCPHCVWGFWRGNGHGHSCTGLEKKPSMGFPPNRPQISFLRRTPTMNRFDFSRLPKANMCVMDLKLPTIHTVYEDFEEAMDMAIRNSEGFGFAWRTF